MYLQSGAIKFITVVMLLCKLYFVKTIVQISFIHIESYVCFEIIIFTIKDSNESVI